MAMNDRGNNGWLDKNRPSKGQPHGNRGSSLMTTTMTTFAPNLPTVSLVQTVLRPMDCYYYESTNLPLDDPARYIRAPDADMQVQQAPQPRPQPRGGAPVRGAVRGLGRGYPKPHGNREHNTIPAAAPYHEFPLLPDTTIPWVQGTPPGPVRAIYNNNNRNQYGVVYHDPTKNGPLDFSLSQRRDPGYRG